MYIPGEVKCDVTVEQRAWCFFNNYKGNIAHRKGYMALMKGNMVPAKGSMESAVLEMARWNTVVVAVVIIWL